MLRWSLALRYFVGFLVERSFVFRRFLGSRVRPCRMGTVVDSFVRLTRFHLMRATAFHWRVCLRERAERSENQKGGHPVSGQAGSNQESLL
jgi:hypothetical protein